MPHIANTSKRFVTDSLGTHLSDDFACIASDFESYRSDNLIAAGLDPSASAPPFSSSDLNTFDNVEEASQQILDNEDFIIHKDKDNETKN